MYTKKDLIKLKNIIEIEKTRRLVEKAREGDYLSYVKLTNTGFKENRHSLYIIDKIQKALEKSKTGEIQILNINLPPQHGKSMLITKTLPSFYLMNNPNKNTLIVSYNEGTAIQFGRVNRDKIREWGWIYNKEIAKDMGSVLEYGLEGSNGYILSTGVGGSITSRTGNLIIIDDPYKSLIDASSSANRKKVEDIFDSAIKTRMHPGTILILIMNRWHEDDIVSYVKETYGDRVIDIVIPAEAGEDDILGRDVGEYLWLEHHDKTFYEDMKSNSFVWASQYQQNPSSAKGGEYNPDYLNYYNLDVILDNNGRIDVSYFDDLAWGIDGASKKGKENDFTSIMLVGRIGDRYLILFREKGKWDILELEERVVRYFKTYNCRKIIEDKNSGTQLIQILKNRYSMTNIVEQKADRSTGGKEIRAQYILPILKRGQIYVPNGVMWDDFFNEMKMFPYGTHDDEFDNLVQIITDMDTRYLQGKHKDRVKVVDKPDWL